MSRLLSHLSVRPKRPVFMFSWSIESVLSLFTVVLPHSLVSLLSDNTLFHGASQSKLVPDEKNNSHFVCVIPTVSDPRYEIMAILLATI